MQDSYWYLNCHDDRNPQQVNEISFKPTGQFWEDLQTLCNSLQARPHLTFRNPYTPPPEDQEPIKQYQAVCVLFDNFSLAILVRVLQTQTTINHLRFNYCNLSQEQTAQLQLALSNEHIQMLQFDWSPNLPQQIYSNFLSDHSKLKILSLRGCQIDDEGIELIAGHLKINKHLQSLDLYRNQITTIEPIAASLEENRTLESLNLSDNRLTDDHVKCLCSVIGRHPFPEDQVEEHRKRELERDKIVAKNAKARAKNQEPVPIVDPIEQDEDSGEWFIIKNTVFKQLNLSLNNITDTPYIKDLLGLTSPDFQIILLCNPLLDMARIEIQREYKDKVAI